ncbi:MAG: AI-2E family transporter [Candidatus Hydrogenedentes bacterium]|nr:AI-2E family transporter [Candidatus Hydrogenedentota bacterium]
MRTVIENPWVRAAGALIALVLLGLLAYALRPVLVPLFLALLVAYVLDPVVDFFEARRIPRMATIVGLAFVAVVLLLSVPLIIVPSVFHQASTLVASARGVYPFDAIDKNGNGAISLSELTRPDRGFDSNDFILFDTDRSGGISETEWDAAMAHAGAAKTGGNALLDRLFDLLPVNQLVNLLELNEQQEPPKSVSEGVSGVAETGDQEPAEDAAPAADPADTATGEAAAAESQPHADGAAEKDARALLAEFIGKNVRDFTVEFMKTHASSLASFGQQAGVNLFGFVASIGQSFVNLLLFLANFALFAIVAGYLLKDFDPLKATARTLIPPRYAPKTLSILGKIDDQLRSFLRGQMTVCICLGVMYTIGFLVFGVPFAIVIGMFSIMASFIPFVGVATTAILGILLTILQHGIDWHLIGVLAVVGVAQFLEGNVLTPKIVGEQVGLNPVWVILAIMVFGNFLGFLGLLLAVPIAAALKVLVVEGVAYYKASPVFAGDAVDEPAPPGDDDAERRKNLR